MRKWLNNPWIVGGMALTAVSSIGGQLNVFGTESARSGGLVSQGVTKALATPEVQKQLSYATGLVNFPESISRDPFALVKAYEDAHVAMSTPAGSLPTAPPVVPIGEFHLQGVSMAQGQSLAVINDMMVAEGEVIDGHRVVRISTDRVVLEGPDGTTELGFHDESIQQDPDVHGKDDNYGRDEND